MVSRCGLLPRSFKVELELELELEVELELERELELLLPLRTSAGQYTCNHHHTTTPWIAYISLPLFCLCFQSHE